MEDLRRGEEILKKLNKLPVPVISVLGNVDYPCDDDVGDKGAQRGKLKWDRN